MPSKNTVKKYVPGGIYHVYNRGVEKRSIFPAKNDYLTLLDIFNLVLAPEEELENADYITIKNKSDSVKLIAYCLMPNHFHLILKQLDETGMTEFMRIIGNAYVSYFNKRYKRVGSLFQGIYKAALIEKDEQLVHVSRYVHINPSDVDMNPEEYPYSSYEYYLDKKEVPTWLDPSIVLEQFKSPKEYKSFAEDHKIDSQKIIKDLTLD